MEKLGFIKDIDWVEYLIKMPEEPNKKLNDLSKLVLKRYKLDLIEPKSRREIKPYLPKIFELLNIAYKDLYGTVELSQAQIMKYYHQFILLVNVEYVKLVMDEEGELVGFALAVPSMNRPVKKSNGRLFPLAGIGY